MRLLLINPNTSVHITERLAASARSQLPVGTTLTALTATEGPRAVRSPAEVQGATERVLVMAREHAAQHDAVVLGISLDCGLTQTRALCAPRPVIGMTEAACLLACLHGPRFGVLTLGRDMAGLYQDHVGKLGLGQRLAGVAAIESPAAFDTPENTVSAQVLDLMDAATQSLLQNGADAIVLAGAVLCGYAPALQQRVGKPVLDGVACAVQLALAQLALARANSGTGLA